MDNTSSQNSTWSHRIFLSLGSNRGDRARYLKRAIDALPGLPLQLKETSRTYMTEPRGMPDQTRGFLNLCIEAETRLAPEDLLNYLQQLETKLGRNPRTPTPDRRIDIDLLFYGQQTIDTENLSVPHPRLHRRRFVLIPLAEIAPAFIHPGLSKTVGELLDNCPDDSEVTPYELRKLSPGSQETPK